MNVRTERPATPWAGIFNVGDRVLIVNSVLGHEGQIATVIGFEHSIRHYPIVVQFANDVRQLCTAESLRWLEGGAR
jgi:hypothetical protein